MITNRTPATYRIMVMLSTLLLLPKLTYFSIEQILHETFIHRNDRRAHSYDEQ
jgi:hypothetical protein